VAPSVIKDYSVLGRQVAGGITPDCGTHTCSVDEQNRLSLSLGLIKQIHAICFIVAHNKSSPYVGNLVMKMLLLYTPVRSILTIILQLGVLSRDE
jgi:hypothetical protein